jgi:hypothetical protein
MNLIGQPIIHTAFGNGVVTGHEGQIIVIRFSAGEKNFLFPDAFEKYLKLKDETLQKEMQKILKERADAKAAEQREFQNRQEKKHLLQTRKLSDNAQAVFDVKSDQTDAVFASWTVYTGHYLSGTSFGKNRIPNRMGPNSLCLLTQCAKGELEKGRRIIGAFMVEEFFIGENCRTGIIKGHPDYRMKLEIEEQPLFWDYFPEISKFPKWGSIPFKYLPNTAVERILFDLVGTASSQGNAKHFELEKQLYEYFCSQNHLPSRFSKLQDSVGRDHTSRV